MIVRTSSHLYGLKWLCVTLRKWLIPATSAVLTNRITALPALHRSGRTECVKLPFRNRAIVASSGCARHRPSALSRRAHRQTALARLKFNGRSSIAGWIFNRPVSSSVEAPPVGAPRQKRHFQSSYKRQRTSSKKHDFDANFVYRTCASVWEFG